MTKYYYVTHEGPNGNGGFNRPVSSIGGIIDAVMCSLEYGGTATVGEITEDSIDKACISDS